MGRSPGFGSIKSDLIALFRLGFPSALYLLVLNLATSNNSPDRSTKSTRSHFINVLPLLVNIEFQVLFHSPPGVLFTFPSQYYYAIGHRGVFRLGGWSPRLPTRFLVSRGTLDPARLHLDFAYGIITLFDEFFQTSSAIRLLAISQSTTPKYKYFGLACFPFARHYLGNRCFFLLLKVLRCFSSLRSLLTVMYWL